MENLKSRLICIIGVDGVGKTAHVRKLLETLDDKKIPNKYVWFRFYHFSSLLLLIYCRLVHLTVYEIKNGQKIGRHEFYKSKIISFLYPYLLFIDMYPLYIIKIYLPLRLGYTMICDRFVYDTLVDLMIDLKNFEIYQKFSGKLFLRLNKRVNKMILLDLDESIIRERRKDLMVDQSLEERRKVYKQLAKVFNIKMIDNSKNFNEVNDSIIKYMGI
jgi:thymidylate kinase